MSISLVDISLGTAIALSWMFFGIQASAKGDMIFIITWTYNQGNMWMWFCMLFIFIVNIKQLE